MENKLKVLEVINKELKMRNWGWPDLARASGVNYATLQNWRDERSLPTNVINLKKTAQALGLSLYYLCYGHEESLSGHNEIIKVGEKEQAIYLKIKLSVYRGEE